MLDANYTSASVTKELSVRVRCALHLGFCAIMTVSMCYLHITPRFLCHNDCKDGLVAYFATVSAT